MRFGIHEPGDHITANVENTDKGKTKRKDFCRCEVRRIRKLIHLYKFFPDFLSYWNCILGIF